MSWAHGGQPTGHLYAQAAPPNPREGTPVPTDSRLQLLARARQWAWITGAPDPAAITQSPLDLVVVAPPDGLVAPPDVERMRARRAPQPRRLVLAAYPISWLEKIDLLAALSVAMSQGVDGIVLTELLTRRDVEALERVAAAARRMDPAFLLIAHVRTRLPRLAEVLAVVDAVVVEGAFADELVGAVPSFLAAARASGRPVLALERSATPARETAWAGRAQSAGVPLYVGPPDLARLAADQPQP